MTHDLRDALIDALRKVCANPEVAAATCLAVVEAWPADGPLDKAGAAFWDAAERTHSAKHAARNGGYADEPSMSA